MIIYKNRELRHWQSSWFYFSSLRIQFPAALRLPDAPRKERQSQITGDDEQVFLFLKEVILIMKQRGIKISLLQSWNSVPYQKHVK